eukprot:4217083-Ditylum_brightwellii.AAC.1
MWTWIGIIGIIVIGMRSGKRRDCAEHFGAYLACVVGVGAYDYVAERLIVDGDSSYSLCWAKLQS